MGGVYRLIGAQLRIGVDGMGMEVLVVFPFFFFFILDEKNWRHRFVEMRGRSEEGKVVSTLAAWINAFLESFWYLLLQGMDS